MSVALLNVGTGNDSAFLYYGVGNTGTQLSLRVDYTGGDQTSNTYPVVGMLPLNMWTRVQLEIDTVAQAVRLTVGGQANAPIGGVFDADPTASVAIGSTAQGGSFSGYIDDLIAYVYR